MDDVHISVSTKPGSETEPESFLQTKRRQWRWYRQKKLVLEATERQVRILRPVLAKKVYFEATHAHDIPRKSREFNDLIVPVQDVLRQYLHRYEIARWVVGCEDWLADLTEAGFLSEEVTLQEYYQVVPKKYACLERFFHALRALKGEYVPEQHRPCLRI